MNKTSPVIIAVVTVVAILAFRQWQQRERVDPSKLAVEDASWRSMPLLERSYRAPPPEWSQTKDSASGVVISTPCEMQSQLMKEDGIEFPVYTCEIDGVTFMLLPFFTKRAMDLDSQRAYWAEHDERMLKKIREGFPAAKVQPEARVRYAGSDGREEFVDIGPAGMQLRELTTPRAAITLGVVGLKENLPGDSQRFFDSLQLD